MTNNERKEYMKAWYQAHKEELSANRREYYRAYYKAHREERKVRDRAYRQAHREERRAYYQAHKEELNANRREYFKAYYQAHREERKVRDREYSKHYYKAHKEKYNEYRRSDTNSQGKTKNSVRGMSRYYLFNVLKHPKIDGYEIHHCFGYEDYKKFIYIPRELHLQIHQFLRDNGISADSFHYNQIEHIIMNYLKSKESHVLVLR